MFFTAWRPGPVMHRDEGRRSFGVLVFVSCAFGVCFLTHINALPATTTTHIVSYVKQKRLEKGFNDMIDFDFESIAMNSTHEFNNLERLSDHDMNSMQNSLFDSDSDGMTADEASTAKELRNNKRVKQSIPVLEPVKHLLNSVREGTFNHSTSHSANPHHRLLSSMGIGLEDTMMHHNDSSVIETEEEREMVNDSNEFKVLDLLGTVGGMLWQFLGNIQKFIAAIISSSSSVSSAG